MINSLRLYPVIVYLVTWLAISLTLCMLVKDKTKVFPKNNACL
jgi:hypothetical protein